jgi:hypothetical protein
MKLRTIDDVIAGLNHPGFFPIEPPAYNGDSARGIGLAVESMKRHSTDEGWQIFEGLGCSGYLLCGHGLTINETDVKKIIAASNPGIVVVQDEREWNVVPGDFRDPAARFTNVEELSKRPDIFKLTILKDSHQNPRYHIDSANKIGCHVWIIYYHPRIVKHVAPYIRADNLIRTWHSVNKDLVPTYSSKRSKCLLSGAVSPVYPLRLRLCNEVDQLKDTDYLKHPGYHRNGTATPHFLQTLGNYKVAICTASIYGYALRKIIEATACGCRVITDLPVDEKMPWIDSNLVRISPDLPTGQVNELIKGLLETYNPELQEHLAEQAKGWYDFREVTKRLAQDIAIMRFRYANAEQPARR